MRGRGYDPFAPVDMQKVKILDDWLQLDEEYPIGSQNNGVEFFKILRTPQNWLNEEILISPSCGPEVIMSFYQRKICLFSPMEHMIIVLENYQHLQGLGKSG
ncbi:PREDICTED: uncharacterized protein LOC106311376 [Brassica oleracea var. oleracea]|nr:PREDICTED: uncharacterized protein LOC106311376 [Brassica oleracea var. oleracea]